MLLSLTVDSKWICILYIIDMSNLLLSASDIYVHVHIIYMFMLNGTTFKIACNYMDIALCTLFAFSVLFLLCLDYICVLYLHFCGITHSHTCHFHLALLMHMNSFTCTFSTYKCRRMTDQWCFEICKYYHLQSIICFNLRLI